MVIILCMEIRSTLLLNVVHSTTYHPNTPTPHPPTNQKYQLLKWYKVETHIWQLVLNLTLTRSMKIIKKNVILNMKEHVKTTTTPRNSCGEDSSGFTTQETNTGIVNKYART